MFTKVLIVCAVAAVALAVEYPAGIHPAVCPNYPYCDMEVLARHTPQGLPIPDWELPYEGFPYARMVLAAPYPYPFHARGRIAAPAPAAAPAAAPAEIPADAPVAAVEPAKYPADFDASLCPNYPTCE